MFAQFVYPVRVFLYFPFSSTSCFELTKEKRVFVFGKNSFL